MQAISVPEDVVLVDPISEEKIKTDPVSFKTFVVGTLMCDERWRRDLDMIECALKIKKAVRAFGKAGDRLLLEDEDHKKLKECAERPTGGYGSWSASVVDQFAPFLHAITTASKDEKK